MKIQLLLFFFGYELFFHWNLNAVQTVLQFSTGLSFPPSCKGPYNVNDKRLTIVGFRVNISIKVRFLLDNEYMDRRNITCLISFIINVTKQNLFATMRGSGRNVYSMPIQDKPKFPLK